MGPIHKPSVLVVSHKEKTLCGLEAVTTQRAGLLGTTHNPPDEADVPVLCGSHLEAFGGSGCHDLSQLQFVQAHCETEHSFFFFAKKNLEEVCLDIPYVAVGVTLAREKPWWPVAFERLLL